MIADRHIFIVGQQRIVGAEQAADIGRVMDAGVKVGVVADRGGQMERAGRRVVQQRRDLAAELAVGEQLGHAAPQRQPRDRAETEQRIERRAGSSFGCDLRGPFEQPACGERAQIEDEVADGDSAASLRARRENAERQILDREIGMAGRALDPAGALQIVRRVDLRGHRGNSAFGKPHQAAS